MGGVKQLEKVPVSRDFPAGCGISSSSLVNFPPAKSVHGYRRDFPPGCGPNAAKVTQMCPEKRLAIVKFSGSCSHVSDWRRSVGSVKHKLPLSTVTVKKDLQKVKGKEPMSYHIDKPPLSGMFVKKPPQKVKGKELMLSDKVKGKELIVVGLGKREKVLEMLRMFRKRCADISRNEKGIKRVDIQADNDLKNEGKITHQSALMVGAIPGVEVGDKFYYRVELMIVGLHRRPQAGIDHMEFGRGKSKIATCIVANERHLDKMNDSNILTYVGEGGNLKRYEVGVPPDQELKGGNLGLWNSMEQKQPVRVVRGLKFEGQKILYVYDGLYEVRDCEKKKGLQGNFIFEFRLIRCPGQPVVCWDKYRCN